MQLQPEDVFWIDKKLPQSVAKLLVRFRTSLFLAGGFIRATIAREVVNDIDLFTDSKEKAIEIATVYAAENEMKVIATDNAVTVVGGGKLPVQFIHRWTFTSPEDCIKSFDFTIARAAYWIGSDGRAKSFCDDRFYSDLAGKRLVYCSPIRNEEAGGSMLRVLKFYQRGYRIPLESLGAVMARMTAAVDPGKLPHEGTTEEKYAHVYVGLLREVDPNIADQHEAE